MMGIEGDFLITREWMFLVNVDKDIRESGYCVLDGCCVVENINESEMSRFRIRLGVNPGEKSRLREKTIVKKWEGKCYVSCGFFL